MKKKRIIIFAIILIIATTGFFYLKPESESTKSGTPLKILRSIKKTIKYQVHPFPHTKEKLKYIYQMVSIHQNLKMDKMFKSWLDLV